jgi:guanine nucleotide-binding protein G(I)/G(S)/G(T) subunit beta-1
MSNDTVFDEKQMNARLDAARKSVAKLKHQLTDITREKGKDGGLLQTHHDLEKTLPSVTICPRREYVGCSERVTACSFAGNSERFASVSHDGNLLMWLANSGHKVQSIKLKCSFVTACALEQKQSTRCAVGGMDDTIYVYDVTREFGSKNCNTPVATFHGHMGYITGLTYLEANTLVSSSGDSTTMVWDITRGVPTATMHDHAADVLCVEHKQSDANIFITGSIDSRVHMYDVRIKGGPVKCFSGQVGDVNALSFCPDGHGIISGCSDGSSHLFDLRAQQSLCSYGEGTSTSEVAGVGVSASGRFIFTGHADGLVRVWNTVPSKANSHLPAQTLRGHHLGITCLEVAPNGNGILTGSEDSTLRIWA